jgi:hypothetical protein
MVDCLEQEFISSAYTGQQFCVALDPIDRWKTGQSTILAGTALLSGPTISSIKIRR